MTTPAGPVPYSVFLRSISWDSRTIGWTRCPGWTWPTALKKVVDDIRPQTVFTHHHGDYNWDHRMAFDATMMACRACPGETYPATIFSYEVPSSTERAFQAPHSVFCPTTYVDIEAHLARKIEALEAYASELGEYPHPRSGQALTHLAAKRGNEVGLPCAEAFCLIRNIV